MAGMGFTLAHAFYEGTGATAEVPGLWDCSLNGHGYMLDTEHPAFGTMSAFYGNKGIASIPLIRQQADSATEPGESTISPDDLWPREQESWHSGGGQLYLDAKVSDRTRFYKSLGIDPWTRWQVSMLNDTTKVITSVNTGLKVIQAGAYVYFADGNTLKWSQAPYTTWTSANIQGTDGTPHAVTSICTDGSKVYAAIGTNAINSTTIGATSSADFNALTPTLIDYVNGRLMAASGAAIYNVTASGAAPTALFTHPNSAWTWTGFAEGSACIYAAGYVGSRSMIYRIPIKQDGTGLDAPIPACPGFPDGEVIYSINWYLGYLQIGTDKGFRLANADTNGNLTIGPRAQTDHPVRCFESQERFVWFGWDDYDSLRTGLGRMDVSLFTDTLVPAYASDLMAGTDASGVQGSVTSVATGPDGTRLFTVDGVGLFVEAATKVASAYVDSGKITFGIPDPKIALKVFLKHQPLPANASVAVQISADDGALVTAGTSNTVGSTAPATPVNVPEMSGITYQVRLVLKGNAVLERYDFRAYPVSLRGDKLLVPILLHEKVLCAGDTEMAVDTLAEYRRIRGWLGDRRLVSYKELGAVFSVFVDSVSFERVKHTDNRNWWSGTLVLQLKALGY